MQASGISSEAIWTAFDSMTTATVRRPKFKVYVAWTRLSDVTNYAIVGSSIVGGTDIIQGTSVADINNADAFLYSDETDRVLRVEYERTIVEPLGGSTIALADILLDNSDGRFTPDMDSTIGTALRPNRPMKIFIGFEVQGQEKLISIIEGLTLSHPFEDKSGKTAKLQVYDYMRWLNQKPQETTIYTNQRSDEIIADILARAGVGSSNYSLDTGLNTIAFAWFEKGQTAGERIRRICEAEEAIFYQDENGTLRFENRDKYSSAPFNNYVWTIEPDDILDWEGDNSSKIINRCIVKAQPRSVKGESEIWRDGIEEEINAGQTLTIWANFENPASDITSPASTTDYTAYSATGGTGTDLTASLSFVTTEFTKSAKLEITNNHGSLKAYVNFLRLRGTPATVDYSIEQVFEDTVSITDYSENQVIIENDFIDSRTFASDIAQGIVRRYKNPRDRIILTVRGIPQLQLRDYVRVKDPNTITYKNYRVMRIQGILEEGGFTQKLYLRRITSEETAS